MKTAVFLSVREKARRLPKKVLRKIAGQNVTEHLIDRLLTAREPDSVVVCTSTHPDDAVLCEIAQSKGVGSFRGSEDDKLDRYVQAARSLGVEFFTVVDGDDLFCSAEMIDEIIRGYRRTRADYIIVDDLPLGATAFGVKRAAMERVMELKKEHDTEVWGGYFTQNKEFKCEFLPCPHPSWKQPKWRMTLDYEEDLRFFTHVIEALHRPGHTPGFAEIMDYLHAHPEVVAMNSGAQERYEQHLKKSAPVRFEPSAPDRKAHRALVVGLGSMGKRRIRCLKHLGVEKIMGFDFREDRRQEAATKYGVTTFGDMQEALNQKPDLMIVSTPPDKHLEPAMQAAQRGIHFFTEAGVLNDQFDRLQATAERNKCVAAPSCTMRFFPGPKKVKEVIDSGAIGRVASFTFHCAQYLPDWHPWEDIRDFYVSKRITGACREIVPFEMVWLEHVFGKFDAVKGMRGNLGDLGVDIDDVYHLLLRGQGGRLLGHLSVDVLSRPAVRYLRAVGTGGLLTWDASSKTVSWIGMDSKEWTRWTEGATTVEKGYTSPEEPYIEEMRAFLEAAEGVRPYGYTYLEDSHILSLLYAAEAQETTVPGRVAA